MEHQDSVMRSAAHDIRGFLASASLATEHLCTHTDARVARSAERISSAIEQIVTICQHDLSQPVGSAATTHHLATDISILLEQISDLIAPKFEDYLDQPTISIRVAADLNIDCHSSSLFRILYNLSVNAAHAIAGHNGSRIELSAVRDGSSIRFVVVDDGPGLPDHIIDHLYPRIDRPEPTGKRIGYGLMSAVGLAKEMQGTLHVIKSSPSGTTFSLVLPDRPG